MSGVLPLIVAISLAGVALVGLTILWELHGERWWRERRYHWRRLREWWGLLSNDPSDREERDWGGEELARSSAAASVETEGARLVALNMVLSGSSREETSNYLRNHFGFEDDGLFEDVYREACRSAQ
jgi:hypothetical protein